MPENTQLQSQLIENGALKEESAQEGFIVDGDVAGVITIRITRVDEFFMRFQHYFGQVFNIAKHLGSIALVVTLEGESNHRDWFQMLRNHGLRNARGNKLRYQISRSELEYADIG